LGERAVEQGEESAEDRLARYLPQPLAAKIRATRGRIEGERRQVTVLFCDLADSTRLAEGLGPEIYREFLDDYLERASGCIHRYEGVIAQFAGDGFMAIFGAPIAHDDDAARACRAALDILAELRLLSRDWHERAGGRIAARIGMNTGLAIVGSVGSDLRMEYSAIGDTTNVASRIEAFAAPGEAYLSDATRRLVAAEFETEEVATEAFKGKSRATTVFRLVRAIPRSERRHQALRHGLSRYVGRGTELSLLRERFDEAARGAGQVVFLAGEAGIGKSRLVHEFRRGLPEDYTWLEGQCVSYGASMSYLPIVDLLRGHFEIDEADSAEVVVEKVERACAELGGPVKDAAPFYRDLLGVDPGDVRLARMEERLRSGHYFESVRNLVHALAQRRPTILLVEDVHWVDDSSEQLLRRLFDSLAGAPVLAIASHRSEYTWPHGERSYFSRVQLRGLGEQLVDELARSVLGRDRLAPALRRTIAERSDGNPFFIEEVVKSLAETGLLEGGNVDESLLDRVPSTVQEVLLARIDRLDDAARRTLQIASVIGREFTVRILERVAEADGASELLEDLRGLELIYEKSVYPELAYMFKHALTHDVAYQTLLESQRRALHETVAKLIEELYAERLAEFYETLSFQYRQAEMAEKGAHYALLSGERAAKHLAPEAEEHFRRAARWSRGRDGSEDTFVRAQVGLADHLMRQGHIDAANEALREALDVASDPDTRRFLHNKVVQRRFFERDGARIAYYVHGEGVDGDPSRVVPIVFLHPVIQGSYSFQDLAQRLCQEYCVIYLDPRGVGASDPYPAGFDFEICVADVLALLKSLPYERLTLNGDSDGVPLALRAYHEMPERIANLVLFGFAAVGILSPDHPVLTPEQRRMVEVALLEVDYRTSLENFLQAMANEPGMTAWRETFTEDVMGKFEEDFFKGFLSQAARYDLRPLLTGVTAPTLVIAAEHDGIPVQDVRRVAEGIPGSQWALIEGASHYAPWTAIETFREIMTTFLRTGSLPREHWQP
jgi:class 3 adenylate cyclase/pimeloyl-ACP methyl ester carboxylesterase